MKKPSNVNPVQWNQAIGLARQSCARVYRGGGKPTDAAALFGLDARTIGAAEWDRVIESIAWSLCGGGRTEQRRAA